MRTRDYRPCARTLPAHAIRCRVPLHTLTPTAGLVWDSANSGGASGTRPFAAVAFLPCQPGACRFPISSSWPGAIVGIGGGAAEAYKAFLRRYRQTIGSRRDLARRLNQVGARVTSEYIAARFGAIPATSVNRCSRLSAIMSACGDGGLVGP